jgi:hypothetical protein
MGPAYAASKSFFADGSVVPDGAVSIKSRIITPQTANGWETPARKSSNAKKARA